MTIEFDAFHTGLYVKIVPVLSFDYNYNYGKSENHTKKVGFTLAPSRNSNLIVDVYRATMDKNELNNRVDSMAAHGYTDPKDFGALNGPKLTDAKAREDFHVCLGEIAKNLKEYWFAYAAGHATLSVTDRSVKASFFPGDARAPSQMFELASGRA